MKPSLVILAIVVIAAAAGYGTTRAATKTMTVAAQAKKSTAREIAQFGYIRSLKRTGGHFELRFDPAWFLSGKTANAAAAEDGTVAPGEPVPNDNYVVDEGHRLVTYIVPATAQVTVLTRGGDPTQLGATPITVSELAWILNGGKHRPLFEPITTGFWLRIDVDTVGSLAQQYGP